MGYLGFYEIFYLECVQFDNRCFYSRELELEAMAKEVVKGILNLDPVIAARISQRGVQSCML